jgi:glycosyltransferase involved in cell wall biosynthesis
VEPSILGGIAGRLRGAPITVWGVRASNVDYSYYGKFSWLTFKLAAALSTFPRVVVANSDAGRRYHIANGYPADRFVTIPNGIDVARFRLSDDARRLKRAQWGVADTDIVVGIVARLDPIKRHDLLLEAADILSRRQSNVRLVSVGGGTAVQLDGLRSMADRLGIRDRVLWLGELDDVASVYPAFDIVCSCSTGEGFSNSIGEAMACGVPCIATDVGDARAIIGDTGVIVTSGDAVALADAIGRIAMMTPVQRAALGGRARLRIVREFGLDRMLERTAAMYRELVGGTSRPTTDQWASRSEISTC